LKKLTDGLQGRSSASDPLLSDKDTGFSAGQMTEQRVMSWANSGLAQKDSGVGELQETATLVRLEMLLTRNNQGGGDQTPMTLGSPLILNGWFGRMTDPVRPSIGLFSFPAGVSEWNILLANSWPAGTAIQYGLFSRGSNTSGILATCTFTLTLYGVTGTWVQETKNDPEIR
jgi:hypothetical protein